MKPTVAQICDNIAPMQTLDPDWDGSCPCGEIKGDGFTIQTKCWRTGDHPNGCAMYVTGKDIKHVDKMMMATHIVNSIGWRSDDWHVYIDGQKMGTIWGDFQ